ncbi:hypothetical protein [Geodermatophilus sp. SYSU D00710]
MYATIHGFRITAGHGPGVREVVDGCLPAGASPAGLIVLDDVEDPGRGTVVALWADEPATDRVYRVTDELHGRATGRRPLFAQVTWLDTGGDPARADAAEHGGRDRIWPAVRDIDGIVEVLALRSTDDRIVVIGLATATEARDRVQQAVVRTELLPDEDPALLPGHDRVEMARVLLAELPTGVRS